MTERLWTVIRYWRPGDEDAVFHVLTPWGWAMLRDNAPGWEPPAGYEIVRKGTR